MNLTKNDIFKNFTIGFIPIIIFLVADFIYGAMAGILIALIFGITEFIIIYIKNRKIEKFIIFDIGLMILFGLVSLLLENEFFFEIKPAVIEFIIVIILTIHGFSNKPLLLILGKRYMPDIKMQPVQLNMLKKMARLMSVIFLMHTILIVWSALYWSKEAWAFISGGLFYIIFGLLFLAQMIYLRFFKKKKGVTEEWFDIVDRNGKILGKAPRSQIHGNPSLIHSTIHVHVFNDKGLLFLQKRVQSKDLYPGRWDTAIGGHVSSGESIQQALIRESMEELSLNAASAQPLFRYVMTNKWESELIHTFKLVRNGPFKLAPDEIEEGRFWNVFEIKKNLGKDIFTPNFEQEFAMLQELKLI